MASCRPYPDLQTLLAAADEAFYDLRDDDLTQAMAGESSSPEGLSCHDTDVPGGRAARLALDAAHAEYQERFAHPFLLCLDDYPADEALDQLLAALRSRLGNEPEQELQISAEELRRMVLSRLRSLATDAGAR